MSIFSQQVTENALPEEDTIRIERFTKIQSHIDHK